MENTLGIIGTITGVLGLFLAIFATIRQAKAEERQKRSDRLTFLADRIFDSSIPRELRQPFYEEYISMKGNGTAVRFWLLEGEREKKAINRE
jgi:hypothetical protein